jgi:alpha-mannosidase
MNYLDEFEESLIQERARSFYENPLSNPLPTITFAPKNSEYTILALQVYVDVMTLLNCHNEEFNPETFSIETLRERIYHHSAEIANMRNDWVEQKDEIERFAEASRLLTINLADEKKKLAIAENKIRELENIIKFNTSAQMMQEVLGDVEKE